MRDYNRKRRRKKDEQRNRERESNQLTKRVTVVIIENFKQRC